MTKYVVMVVALVMAAQSTAVSAAPIYVPGEGEDCHPAFHEVHVPTGLGKSTGAAKSIHNLSKTQETKRYCYAGSAS